MGILEWLEGLQPMMFEIQVAVLMLTLVFLVAALVLLNRAADELDRSRFQRERSEKAFDRVSVLLSRAESSELGLNNVRNVKRSSSRPISSEYDGKRRLASKSIVSLREARPRLRTRG